jgi:hypothetical protein
MERQANTLKGETTYISTVQSYMVKFFHYSLIVELTAKTICYYEAVKS